jgi:hypothetical protein
MAVSKTVVGFVPKVVAVKGIPEQSTRWDPHLAGDQHMAT